MGDNFDTILYIIIGLVAFVISAIGKKKKAPIQSQRAENPFAELDMDAELPIFKSFEDLLNDQVRVEKPVFQKVAEDKEVKKIVQEGRSPFIEKNSLLTKKYIKHTLGNQQNEDSSSPISDSDLTKAEQEVYNVEEFDLKQAVINSEILNRKQY
ncbi:MAG: hypothetical protein A2W99_07890 [Bacteroidetes bacterium GWF2_33_16]|nr:MAG: hypothetical protein A2X00_10945 [Bacteroidetes bacterium GWE2_32_14]OFY03697.1 MAG: hypothetical protein A2W99_07890 [Bacteroidetes bacterium GWF2_33_16]